MYTTYTRYKFNLSGRKITSIIFFLLATVQVFGQRDRINNPNYDTRRWLTYGFSIGIHSSNLQIKHSEQFVSSSLDTLHSIHPVGSPGFSLGFIVRHRLTDLLDLRILPRVSFYEYELEYVFINGTTEKAFVESTTVELPIMLKYKSVRKNNFRMYVAGGFAPAFDASGKNDLEDPTRGLNFNDFNFTMELAIGMDIYYPLFKFSPEIRYSRGLVNVLSDERNDLSAGLDRLNTNNIHIFFLFQ